MIKNQFKKDLYILSAANSDKDAAENQTRHRRLCRNLEELGATFTSVEGCFSGVPEESVILVNSPKMLAHHYANVFGQDCFLRLEPWTLNMHKAHLIDVETGNEDFIGFFRSIPEYAVKALKMDYTRDAAGTYFTVWPTDNYDILVEVEVEISKLSKKQVQDMEKHNVV